MMKLVTLLALTASASGLMVRDKAPDFKAQAVVGDDFEEVSLSQYTEVGRQRAPDPAAPPIRLGL